MKTTNPFLTTIILVFFLCSMTATAVQDEEPKIPKYLTVTTMHWNMDYEDFDMDTWKSVEKEYLEKVTMKNEHVLGSSFYLHNMTPDNTELIYVRTYENWADIEKAAERDTELGKEAWPDEDKREAFYKKQSAYYSSMHSDEIYSTLPIAKVIPPGSATKDMVVYVRTNHLAFPEDGSTEEIRGLMDENFDKIIKNNPLVKGYYTHRHVWGQDGTEMIEAYFLDSMTDLDKMFEGLPDLYKSAWPDEKEREARGKKIGKYFTGVHGDAVYTWVYGLSK